jgi:hypothetical protein
VPHEGRSANKKAGSALAGILVAREPFRRCAIAAHAHSGQNQIEEVN